jgi:hypothetical protein
VPAFAPVFAADGIDELIVGLGHRRRYEDVLTSWKSAVRVRWGEAACRVLA